MSDKPKMVGVTDPTEIEELLNGREDIGLPFPLKPNGHLWADADELQAWREGRK